MARQADYSPQRAYNLSLNIPGWLLVAALLFAAAYVVLAFMRTATSSEPSLSGPVRVTMLESATSGGIFTATLILESDDTLAKPAEGWTIGENSGPAIPAVANVGDTGARNTHALRVQLFASIPAGREARVVNWTAANNAFSGSWGVQRADTSGAAE